jgi:cyclic pyranopterin phosphate synthase
MTVLTPVRDLAAPKRAALVDGFGRTITYLRLSVTDRCDLRCTYCMSERMTFLPKAEVLSIDELDAVASAFIGLGVRKLRLTGGEPLVRRGIMDLIQSLSRHLKSGALDEITLTTNGSRLAEFAFALAANGVRRVNVSLDSLEPETFRRITRGGDVARTIAGIDAALAAGLKVKINTVALAADNAAEIADLIAFAHARGCDISLIETMPMGEVEADRTDQYISLQSVRESLSGFWTLTDIADTTGGPSRYVRVAETGGRLGFITPMSNNFCGTCNRVRLTCTGVLHGCLGREDSADLRAVVRGGGDLEEAIREAIDAKPERHDFQIARGLRPSVARHMSTTGG